MTGSTAEDDAAEPTGATVSASENSVAIGRVDAVEQLNLTAQNVHMNVYPASDQPAVLARNAVATADAVSLGPLASTDAESLLNQAKELSDTEPAAALALYRDVQHRLVSAGFPGHAREFDRHVAALCVATGDEGTAIRLMMDELWAADTAGQPTSAALVLRMLQDLAGYPELGSRKEHGSVSPALDAAVEIADFVSDHLGAVLPQPIVLPTKAIELAEPVDRARTVLFAAEHSLGNDDSTWVINHQSQIAAAAVAMARDQADISVRLRLTLADASGEWSDLIATARSGIRRGLKALILARHARHQLLLGRPVEADRSWQEAIGEACLAERHIDAADWLFSQRWVASRYLGPGVDKWHPLAHALLDLPSQPRIIAIPGDTRERALAALHYDQLRAASIDLRRHLLESMRSASFFDEREARRLLGEIYCDTGELPLSAIYTIQAGDYENVPRVAQAFGDHYHDVTEQMRSPLSWVAACAFQFAAEQADLIPDDDVGHLVELAFSAINDRMTGTRLDSPIFSPKMYLAAFGLIAALAERLPETQARTVLEMLAPNVATEKHHHHYTDESHAQIATGIARSASGDVHDLAVDQLIGLYERGAQPFGLLARETLLDNLNRTGSTLRQMANDGDREAAALLAYRDTEQPTLEEATAAAQRLCQPTTNGPSGFSTGSGDSINDSLLALRLPASERKKCIEMLMANAGAPWEPATNRDVYLRAASNLIKGLDDETRRDLFNRALDFATKPPPSEADSYNQSFSSPLGFMRINDKSDCRPAAAFLAALLATAPDEKRLVRDVALRLIGIGTDHDSRIAQALWLIRDVLRDSLPFLAQTSPALRRVAARIWAGSADSPERLGMALCRDPDPSVRRSLAWALTTSDHHHDSEVRSVLAADPRWSVRSRLSHPQSSDD